jgi:hypothetical protein
VVADAARVMPHTLRRVDVGEEALAELNVLIGFDDDLAAEATTRRWNASSARGSTPRP